MYSGSDLSLQCLEPLAKKLIIETFQLDKNHINHIKDIVSCHLSKLVTYFQRKQAVLLMKNVNSSFICCSWMSNTTIVIPKDFATVKASSAMKLEVDCWMSEIMIWLHCNFCGNEVYYVSYSGEYLCCWMISN